MKNRLFINISALISFTILVTINYPAFADTVELISGQIIEGKVLSLDSKVIKINSNADKFVVNREQISKITFNSNDNKSQTPKTVLTNDKSSTSKVTDGKQITLAKTNNKQKNKNKQIKPVDDGSKLTLKPKVILSQEDKTATGTNNKIVITPDSSTNKPAPKNDNVKIVTTTPETKLITPKVKINRPKQVPSIDYMTYVAGATSQHLYMGIYSNAPEENNLTIYLPDKTPAKLSFKLHGQKNGKIPPLYTASSIVFIDKTGSIISKTNPAVLDNDTFIEWFKNLEDIAGITGNKIVDVTVPSNTFVVKIVGYRPGSKNNLVGYVSEIKLDNTSLETLNIK